MQHSIETIRGLRLAMLALVCAALGAGHARAAWDWTIYPDLYSTLNQFQRADYDKTASAMRRAEKTRNANARIRAYRDVALQWKKVRVVNEPEIDPGIVAHFLFMEGVCQRKSLDRNTAIRSFTEVLDFFPDELWVAAPALYMRGMVHYENGDDGKGLADMRTMIADPDYRLHALAAGAQRRVAEVHWQKGEKEQAMAVWADMAKRFQAENKHEADAAANLLLDGYIRNQQFEEIIEWALPEARRQDDAARVALARRVRQRALGHFGTAWRKYNADNESERVADKQAFYDWFCGQRTYYVADGQAWGFLMDAMGWIHAHGTGAGDVPTYIDAAIVEARRDGLAVSARDDRLAWVIGTFWARGEKPSAYRMLAMLRDRGRALWMEYEYRGNKSGQWTQAFALLDKLTALDPEAHGGRVLREKARVQHHVLKDYRAAVQLYFAINEPPKTLWQIQSCYRAMDQTDKAMKTLKEITSMFPADAAKATFTQAEYMRADEKPALATALYRRILAHPEWTRLQESSLAHQRLEGLGVKTGGGVIYED